MAVAVTLPVAAGYFAAPAASASGAEPAGVTRMMALGLPTAGALLPRANSAWAYDTGSPGTWVDAIDDYNQQATTGHNLAEVFSYATDLEMYCPGNDGARCTASDLYSFYTPGGSGRASTEAYYHAFNATDPDSFAISPIIDGLIEPSGYLQGFNELPSARPVLLGVHQRRVNRAGYQVSRQRAETGEQLRQRLRHRLAV